ncbi:MAG: hypothetical protein J5819_04460 [Eubacterium sp.]|nr:hypothetical protein [Eubacterium sp.]
MLPGVYRAEKKDGTVYYRASITYRNKHISLGSFSDEEAAHRAYVVSGELLDGKLSDDYEPGIPLPFKKWVSLINFRDNDMYIKTPIYLKERFFYYYFAPEDYLIFDSDDLFYYSTHSIMRRGGHLFVADFGMQVNILSRYGIKNYAVKGRDFIFVNGDDTDYRRSNIRVINIYNGVQKKEQGARVFYETKIHIRGDVLVGRYPSEWEAAAAYNKAVHILSRNENSRNYTKNYIVELNADEYREIYNRVNVSAAIYEFADDGR